jgi:HrpA-like RNA helicase
LVDLGAIGEQDELTALGKHIVLFSSILPMLVLIAWLVYDTCRYSAGEGKSRSNLVPFFCQSSLQMLVLGTIFRCLNPILSLASILSSKPLFLNPMDRREEANQSV